MVQQKTLDDPEWAVIAHHGAILFPNSLAGLAFGSRVIGSARPDSDYDIAIVMSEVPDRSYREEGEYRFRERVHLPVSVFWTTPHGLDQYQTLDIVTFSVVHHSVRLWGPVELPWHKARTFPPEGVADVLRTVEAMTDDGTWLDVPFAIVRYAWRLLAYTCWAVHETSILATPPMTDDKTTWAEAIRRQWIILHRYAEVLRP